MEKCKYIFIIGNNKQAYYELKKNLIDNYDGYKLPETYFIIRLNENLLKNKELLDSLIKSHILIFSISGSTILYQVYSNYSNCNQILLYYTESLAKYELSIQKFENMNIIASENQNSRGGLLNEFLDKQLHQQINFKQSLLKQESIQLLQKCLQQILECFCIYPNQRCNQFEWCQISVAGFFKIIREKEFLENQAKKEKNHNSSEESQQKTRQESQLDQNKTLMNNEQGKQSNQEIHKSDNQYCQSNDKNIQQNVENGQIQNISTENNASQFSQSSCQQVQENNCNEEETKKQDSEKPNDLNQQGNVGYCQQSLASKNQSSINSDNITKNNNQMSEIQQKKRNQIVGDLKILLVSIEEIQDLIFKPKQSKNKRAQTNKFENLNVNGCNLKFFKSPLFQTENEEIILEFKNFFQKNQVNIILFCITIQRNDIMKQRIDKMVTKFVGVSRAQLGIIIYNPYQQLTETEYDYLKNLKSRLKFQFFCLVNQDDTEGQILDQLVDQFQDITPQKLDLKETEFAEETEEDKRQQKKLEQSLFNMQLEQIHSQIHIKQNLDNQYIQEIKDEDYKIQELKKLLYQSEQIKREKEYRRKEVKQEIDTLQTKYDNLRKKIQYKY